ncbi:pyridoxal-dependent decarboxylase, exosortase A system-associated [Motiliproteus sp. SC1-56]|uniref:pyridoxal-dependent decarboxylase, exosortase A system-associated n=1 Tax=Motiliproteus sp. SC1-56 TaxID=2799565 RepID=UPI001A8EA8EE|nr:pyridoxal-dependent decarboxylase, exosortase A system-associated [Motiliproteus sp. SC1-56]
MKTDRPATHASQWPDIRNNEYYVGGKPLTRHAAVVGRTPFYAYDRGLIRQRIDTLRQQLPKGIKLHYAIKANPMPALVDFVTPLVDGLDVASKGEMRIALDAGMEESEISFAGPGKNQEEIVSAVAAGIVVTAESFLQVEQIAKAARSLNLKARLALRLNPSFELKASGMKMTGGAKPFGIDSECFADLIEYVRAQGLEPEGLHLFTGSQNLNPQALCEALQGVTDLCCQLVPAHNLDLRFINMGGGFGIPYFPGEPVLDLAPVMATLGEIQSTVHKLTPQTAIALEFGRYIVGEAGIYVSRVIDKKCSRGTTYLVTDGGLHHHLANSGNFGQVIRKNYPVQLGNRVEGNKTEVVTVVGPLCTPLDILAERVELPEAQIGDLVVVRQSGAYGLSASPTAFLSHPLAAEILV